LAKTSAGADPLFFPARVGVFLLLVHKVLCHVLFPRASGGVPCAHPGWAHGANLSK